MTAEEIRKTNFDCDDGTWESAQWLREIAAQLAELNQNIWATMESDSKTNNRIKVQTSR
jgi:hypothetical protein